MKLVDRENGPALVLLKKINRLEKRRFDLEIEIQLTPPYRKRDKVAIEIERLKEQLPEICTHNETKRIDEYQEGSYYDRCKYIHITECAICGKELHREVTTGGYG
jgi:hypothetical protein